MRRNREKLLLKLLKVQNEHNQMSMCRISTDDAYVQRINNFVSRRSSVSQSCNAKLTLISFTNDDNFYSFPPLLIKVKLKCGKLWNFCRFLLMIICWVIKLISDDNWMETKNIKERRDYRVYEKDYRIRRSLVIYYWFIKK